MMILVNILLAATLHTGTPCGAYDENAEMSLQRFLTAARLDSTRAEFGISSSEASTVSYLTDDSTCDIIRLSAESQGIGFDTEYRGFRYVMFQSQNFYYLFAFPQIRPDGLFDIGVLPLIVMNRSYEIVGGILW